MYKVSTPNILPLANVGWTLVTVIIVPCQTPLASKNLTYQGLIDDLYISIPRIMTTSPISRGVLSYLNKY